MRLFSILAALALTTSLARTQQYSWVQVAQIGNQFNALQSVTFVDPLHGWIGDGTTGFHYTVDGGNTWFPGNGATVVPYSISMFDTLVGWAAGWSGSAGGIHKTTNGGLSWVEQRFLFGRRYEGSATQSKTHNIAVGSTRNFSPDTGKIVQTTDGGLTWTERTMADSIGRLGKTQFVDSLHGWIVYGGGLLRTVDGGSTFETLPSHGFFSISFLDTLNGFAVYDSVYRTSDGGRTWRAKGQIADPFWGEVYIRTLSFTDTLNGWGFGFQFYQGDITGTIYHSSNGGTTWNRELIGPARHVNDGIMIDRYHGWAVGDGGSVFAYRIVTSVPEKLPGIPEGFALNQNYPNPLNPSTTISYSLSTSTRMTLKVYDVVGREVATLVDGFVAAGYHQAILNALDLSSGVYFYRLQAGEFVETKKLVLLK